MGTTLVHWNIESRMATRLLKGCLYLRWCRSFGPLCDVDLGFSVFVSRQLAGKSDFRRLCAQYDFFRVRNGTDRRGRVQFLWLSSSPPTIRNTSARAAKSDDDKHTANHLDVRCLLNVHLARCRIVTEAISTTSSVARVLDGARFREVHGICRDAPFC